MIKQVKAPNVYNKQNKLLFLCGSIEMGKAEEWQERFYNLLESKFKNSLNYITVLNPRRDDWDSSWEQSIENKEFKQQVEWEMQGIIDADFVVFYFDPNTKSPITLYELGLVSRTLKRVYVVCPEGFYRKGNVDVICNFFKLKQYSSLEEVVENMQII